MYLPTVSRALELVLAAVILAAMSPVDVRAQGGEDPFGPACSGDNPYFVTTCYARGSALDEAALVAFNDSDTQQRQDHSTHVVMATFGQIGAAYGVAYDPRDPAVYVAAYLKRGSPFGPGGPGMIYKVWGGQAEQWLAVPNVGVNPHDAADDYWPDTPARDWVGKMGLGDIELSADGTQLFAMNLNERAIYRYRLADKAHLATIPMGAAQEPWADDARPFGLKVRGSTLYHAVVNTAMASQDPSQLEGFVYASRYDGSDMRMVTRFDLAYDRGNAVGNVPARWLPWKDGYNAIGGRPGQWGVYPQPIITDIEFAPNGDMVLGLRDRMADMTFFDPGGRNPPGEGVGFGAGDILLAHFNGDTWDTQTVPEFFRQDAGPGFQAVDAGHDETSFGGLARVHVDDRVVMTALTPWNNSSGGAYWFSTSSGENTAREEIYDYVSQVNFGKANGLGDAEELCDTLEEPTPTPTATAPPSSTPPPPTATPPPTGTPTAMATPPPTERTSKQRATQPGPSATPSLPKLPRTGGGPGQPRSPWWPLALALVVAVAAATLLDGAGRRRRGRA